MKFDFSHWSIAFNQKKTDQTMTDHDSLPVIKITVLKIFDNNLT